MTAHELANVLMEGPDHEVCLSERYPNSADRYLVPMRTVSVDIKWVVGPEPENVVVIQ